MRAAHFSRRCWRRPGSRTTGLLLLGLVVASEVAAEPTIVHEGTGCIPRHDFTRFVAAIEPSESVRAAKIYFRSSLFPEFYFVAMTEEAGRFSAVLPLPSEETTRVVYYIEVVDGAFETARSAELVVDVADGNDCLRGPGALPFAGGDPAIVIGAAKAGLPALPAGFQASGVVGFLSASGTVAPVGGPGLGFGLGLGAVAGAAAGLGVLVAGGGEEAAGGASTTVPVAGAPTSSTVPPATASSTSPPGPTTPPATTSVSGVPPETTTTSVSGVPPSETTTTAPSAPTTTSSVSAPTACFTWMPAGSCKVRFDAGCSTAGIVSYEWTLLGPPVPAPPQVPAFTFDFAADPRCGDGNAFNRPVRLRVADALGRSDTVQQNVWVPQSFGAQLSVSTVTLSSRLLHPSGTETLAGWLTVDASTPLPVTSAERREYFVRVDPKGSLVEGTVQGRVPPGTLWDIAILRGGSAAFRVEAGTPVAVEDHRIVFRLSGAEGERIRFRAEPWR